MGREEIRAPLKMPAGEARVDLVLKKTFMLFYYVNHVVLSGQFCSLKNERFLSKRCESYLHVHSKAKELNPKL